MEWRFGARRPRYNDATENRKHRPDYWLLIIPAILLTIGLVVVYSISPGLAAQHQVTQQYYISKQLIAVLLGVAAFIFTARVSFRFWQKNWRWLAYLSIFAAGAVWIFGHEAGGATRWLQISGISFQAAELIKFSLVMGAGVFLTERIKNGQVNSFQRTVKPLLFLAVAVTVVVGIIESDLGSAAVMMCIIAAMAFMAGLPTKYVVQAAIIGVGIILVLTLSSGYRRDRLFTFLNPNQDCLNEGYQACQALIAVGSGGMVGRGLGHSIQAYGYLPEAANDSIFAIMAEKFGFIGMACVLGLFVALFARIKQVLERTGDDFTRLIVAGVLAWFSTQTIINIGAMLGVLPLKGITLPFVSYGGTSLLFVMAALGVVYQASRLTSTASVRLTKKEESQGDYSSQRRGIGRAYNSAYSRLPRA